MECTSNDLVEAIKTCCAVRLLRIVASDSRSNQTLVRAYARTMETTPRSTAAITPDDFRVLSFWRDRDALALVALGAVLLLGLLAALAFLPDTAWNQLVERAQVLWLAALAVAPIVLALLSRFGVRIAGALALGRTAAAVAPEIARGELYANANAARIQHDLDHEIDDEDTLEAQAFHAKHAADPTHNGEVDPTPGDAG